jgi:hypothetical protein
MAKGADFSASEARRIAIAAQGFAPERPGAVTRRHVRALAERLGAIQIDSVNVVARSHYLPPFARLGAYKQATLEDSAWGRKPDLFEYWGHAASLMPVAMQPLFRWRMAQAEHRHVWGARTIDKDFRAYAEGIVKTIETRGPVTGGDFAEDRQAPGWWNWSKGKQALEWLFYAGRITTRTRRNFERVYDLAERVLPEEIANAPTPTTEDAHRQLLLIAARAYGVATEIDLRDYFRMPVAETRARLGELVEAGALRQVSVEGWDKPAYLHPDAKRPRRGAAGALLSPFDSLIWFRARTERLFGLRVKLEIYTPASERQHGYYVLPFLMGESIAARVDLKSDRQAGVLRVQASHLEPGAHRDETTAALARELNLMSDWLGLSGVAVARRGDLATALTRAVKL